MMFGDSRVFQRLQAQSEQLYVDTCVIQSYVDGSQDDYGFPSHAYVDGSAISCSLNDVSGDEVMGRGEVEIADAQMRIPPATTIANADRVKLTHRMRHELSVARVYEVVGIEERGAFGKIIALRLLTEE